MKIDLVKVEHPAFQDREITVIFIDDSLDIPSFKFLLNEARYGGRHNGISGKTTHKGRAVKISELYRHLHDMQKTWNTATETDIVAIRNAMLHWDKNDNEDTRNYNYKKISHNAMNQKIGTWFKFYKFMAKIEEEHTMCMRIKKVPRRAFNKLLSHLDSRIVNKGSGGEMEIWDIRVQPDPERNMYHALTRSEFEVFDKELKKIDLVFSMISNFMVETGLRIDSALHIKKSQFKKYFILLNQGKNINEAMSLEYVSKGGHTKIAKVPVRFVMKLQTGYLAREHPRRFKHYKKKNINHNRDEDVLFLLKNGRQVNATDVRRAFRAVSKKLSYSKPITPHWMRHAFATWFIVDHVNQKNSRPLSDFTYYNKLLQILLGHSSEATTQKYLATAMDILSRGVYRGPAMSGHSFEKNKKVQAILTQEAQYEMGDRFNKDTFDIDEYVKLKGLVVDDE